MYVRVTFLAATSGFQELLVLDPPLPSLPPPPPSFSFSPSVVLAKCICLMGVMGDAAMMLLLRPPPRATRAQARPTRCTR